jgi:hypothetical protein
MFIGAIAGIVIALGVFGAVAWQRLDLSSRFGAAKFSAAPSASSESTPSTERPARMRDRFIATQWFLVASVRPRN